MLILGCFELLSILESYNGCGWKMRKGSGSGTSYICGYHNRFGKNYCSTHSINRKLIEGIILADIQEMLGRNDIYAYVGGLHLYNLTDEELDVLCEEIIQTSIGHIFTGHCTGDHAFHVLKARLGGRIEQFASGFSYCF